MKKEMIQLDISEYLAYILLYAANADFEMAPEELEMIRESISREEFKQLKKHFDASNDAERLQVIMHYRDAYMNVLVDAPAVMNYLKDIFMADERYTSNEKAMFIYLKKLLKL